MVEHTKAIQDKFAEIAAKLGDLDSFFDDIPGARVGAGPPGIHLLFYIYYTAKGIILYAWMHHSNNSRKKYIV